MTRDDRKLQEVFILHSEKDRTGNLQHFDTDSFSLVRCV